METESFNAGREGGWGLWGRDVARGIRKGGIWNDEESRRYGGRICMFGFGPIYGGALLIGTREKDDKDAGVY